MSLSGRQQRVKGGGQHMSAIYPLGGFIRTRFSLAYGWSCWNLRNRGERFERLVAGSVVGRAHRRRDMSRQWFPWFLDPVSGGGRQCFESASPLL